MDNLEELIENCLNDHQEEWCECKIEGNDEWFFVDDDVHPTIAKHHWRCSKCSKLTQIG